MVIRRSWVLLKRIYENQHKFMKVERYCSSSLRIQEYEEQVHQNMPSVTQTHQQPINNICHTPYANYPPAPQRTEDLTPDISFKFKDMNVTLAAPNQLHPKPDVSDLIFGKFFTDHMLKIYYYKQLGGWQRPEIIPFENLAIHPAAKVLHYAVELFEGMKAYRGVDDRIRVFRPDLNMKRMNMSAKRSGLPTFDDEELIQCMNRLISIDQEWVPHSESSSLYIRPTLIGIDPTLGVSSSDSALLYAILCPVGSYFKAGSDGAVSLLADPNVIRAWPGGVGDRKMGSNYAPTIDVQSRASKLGLQQVLWLYGENHQLTEVGTMNIFMVSINEHGEKQITTPPLNGLILPGITRHSILQLARQWGDLLIKEEVITMGEVISLANEGRLLELFGSGTACIVSPIKSINYVDQIIKIPTMQQSQPIFQRVLDTLLAIQYGHIDHPWSRIIN